MAAIIACCDCRWWKNLLIRIFIKQYQIALSECRQPQLASYPNLNSFFTRALRQGARVQPRDPAVLSSPVDGMLYGVGQITEQLVVAVKGRRFTLPQLLQRTQITEYHGGKFLLFYLSPHNYHRIHCPAEGQVTGLTYLPGAFYSVHPLRHRRIVDLLAQNERVVLDYVTPWGPIIVVLVGAALVGSIELIWQGKITAHNQYLDPGQPLYFRRGEELGRFNFGSSVVLLLPPGTWRWCLKRAVDIHNLSAEHPLPVQVGDALLAPNNTCE